MSPITLERPPLAGCILRVVRPTDQMDAVVAFYRDGLGFPELTRFSDHDGFDGAILERSTDNGATWTQVTSGLLTDPYNGAVSTQYSNPLQGLQAWCAEGSPYVKSVVDIQSLAGQSAKFRLRLANDSSVAEPNPGWAVDDVSVQGCTP